MAHIPRWGFWVRPVEPSIENPDPLWGSRLRPGPGILDILGRFPPGDDDEEDATMLAAHHEDWRISFIVDSGAQSHSLQDLEDPGLERPNTSAT